MVWILKEYIRRKHGIENAAQLQSFIRDRVGVLVTVQILRALLRKPPTAPRADLVQLLCDALGCRSDAFYVFEPNPDRADRWADGMQKGAEASRLYSRKSDKSAKQELAPHGLAGRGGIVGRTLKTRAHVFKDPKKYFEKRLNVKG